MRNRLEIILLSRYKFGNELKIALEAFSNSLFFVFLWSIIQPHSSSLTDSAGSLESVLSRERLKISSRQSRGRNGWQK